MRKSEKKKPTPIKEAPLGSREREVLQDAAWRARLSLRDLDDHERIFLAACQSLHRNDTGCNTPFEEFFRKLVLLVQIGRMPTPDMVEREMEEFRENFEDMERDTLIFLRNYPKIAAKLNDAAQAPEATSNAA